MWVNLPFAGTHVLDKTVPQSPPTVDDLLTYPYLGMDCETEFVCRG